MHYNGAGDWLKSIEYIQDNALVISVFVPSLATCSSGGSSFSGSKLPGEHAWLVDGARLTWPSRM
jgi:hypothetical protein